MADIWTIQRTLDWCRGYLERHADKNPRLSAEWLLSAATGLSRVELYAYYDRPLSTDERVQLRESLRRRGRGEPLQYISGEAAFRHLIVKTERGVLIPRPETEQLVQTALDHFKEDEGVKALEVGTGTGCIALSLAKEAHMEVVATDVSEAAVSCARRNAEMLGLEGLVHVENCDCVEGVSGVFDLLVSNPPYIPTAVMAELDREVADFEPRLALEGGEDGLDFFRRLLAEALPLVRGGGFFCCELDETTLDAAAALAREAGLAEVHITNDLAGRPRIVSGVKLASPQI